MAIRPADTYPAQTTAASAAYPHGSAKNKASLGDTTGFPFEKSWVNDLFGFLQSLLTDGNVTPSGAPDEVGNSDYADALAAVVKYRSDKLAVSAHRGASPGSAYTGSFYGAARSASRTVLVGDANRIESSPQMETWTTRVSAGLGFGRDVCFGGGQFVAVGSDGLANGEIQTSPDGITWTLRTPGAGPVSGFKGIASNGSLFVVVGDGDFGNAPPIQTSTDGITWTSRTSGAATNATLLGVCWSGSLFVAVGSGAAGQPAEIRTSPDGITWTQRTADAPVDTALEDVCFGGGLLVAVGEDGEIQTSPDGITWTHRSAAAGFTGYFNSVAYGNGLYVAVADAGVVQVSSNGVLWESLTTDVFQTVNFRVVRFVGDRFVMAGDDGSSGAIRVTQPVRA